MQRYQILALGCGKTTLAICLVFVRLNTLLKSHENFHLSQTLNPLTSKEGISFWGFARSLDLQHLKFMKLKEVMAMENMTSPCQLCKHLIRMGVKCSSVWRLFEGLVYSTSFLSAGSSMLWSPWWHHPVCITSSPCVLLIYSHIYIFFCWAMSWKQ